jgi:virginiamycin A acetyltransferase
MQTHSASHSSGAWEPYQRTSRLAPILIAGYKFHCFQPFVRALLVKTEGGMMCSESLRKLLHDYEGVRLGALSRGAGLRFGLFPRGTCIGRFSCFAAGLKILPRNHPFARLSQHPLFFNSRLGLVVEDTIPPASDSSLSIGSDVWIGMNVIITSGCGFIGDGAIIGAGAVVTKDVPPFTVIAGNPAKPIRTRFSARIQAAIEASKWWERPVPYILAHRHLFTQDMTEELLPEFEEAFPPSMGTQRESNDAGTKSVGKSAESLSIRGDEREVGQPPH